MKFSLYLLTVFIIGGCAINKSFPKNLPDPIGNTAKIYSIADNDDFKAGRRYQDLNQDDLEIFEDFYWVVDQGTISIDDTKSYLSIITKNFEQKDWLSMCAFVPHHAIRYQSEYGTVTALICYSCGVVVASINGWDLRIEGNEDYENSIEALNKIYMKNDIHAPKK